MPAARTVSFHSRALRQPAPIECDDVVDGPCFAVFDRDGVTFDPVAVITRTQEDHLETDSRVAVLPGGGSRKIRKRRRRVMVRLTSRGAHRHAVLHSLA